MTQDILLIALQNFTDWTPTYLAYSIGMHGQNKYRVRVVGTEDGPVTSMGGLRLMTDCDIRHIPTEYAGLVLLGGMGWLSTPPSVEEAIRPLVQRTKEAGIPLGGIGFGADALAYYGVLNDVIHTGNSLAEMESLAKDSYTGQNNYREAAAVRDRHVVTAGAATPSPFARAFTSMLPGIDQETAAARYARRAELSSNPVIIDMDAMRESVD